MATDLLLNIVLEIKRKRNQKIFQVRMSGKKKDERRWKKKNEI